MDKAKNIHEYQTRLKCGEDFYVINVSDVHFDSRKCDRKLLKKHFDFAKEVGGKIIINGDWFDLMGMKRDPRSIPNDIRPEYMHPDASYLDLVIDDSYKFLNKYKENILLIGYGNHETNIIKRQQTDPLKRIWALLGGEESGIFLGGYQGCMIFKIKFYNNNRVSKWFYHHGSGGGAKRSKGILNADILVAQNSWADVITSGHDHQKWHLPYDVKTLTHATNQWTKKRINILRTGSYKKKSTDFGWEVERDFNEPTLGGYAVKYYLKKENGSNNANLIKDIIELK